MADTIIQKIVHFSGMVQGVGFRFTACRVAGGYDVVGIVKNLPDGRVQCIVEGQPREVAAFLAELARCMGSHIHKTTQQTAPPTSQWRNFGVAY
ncbi:MAG: acylphosphatase [Phycisphaerae bacterium]|nr:acylphosphatase [Phycisphaerae bacterium]